MENTHWTVKAYNEGKKKKKNKNNKKNKNTAFLLDRADLGLSLGSGTGENFWWRGQGISISSFNCFSESTQFKILKIRVGIQAKFIV